MKDWSADVARAREAHGIAALGAWKNVVATTDVLFAVQQREKANVTWMILAFALLVWGLS